MHTSCLDLPALKGNQVGSEFDIKNILLSRWRQKTEWQAINQLLFIKPKTKLHSITWLKGLLNNSKKTCKVGGGESIWTRFFNYRNWTMLLLTLGSILSFILAFWRWYFSGISVASCSVEFVDDRRSGMLLDLNLQTSYTNCCCWKNDRDAATRA